MWLCGFCFSQGNQLCGFKFADCLLTGRACQISNLNIISWKVTPHYESVNVSIVDIRIFQGQSQVRASSSLSVGRVLSGKYAELFSCTELLD